MNPKYERQLEEAVDQELKSLRDLAAPSALAQRILKAIELRASLPWYKRSWQLWPRPLQVISLLLLLSMFLCLSYVAWRIPQLPSVSALSRNFFGLFSGLEVVWNTLGVIVGAVVLAVKRLGVGFIFGCFAALSLGYAACFGLGTLCLRLGFSRREQQ